MVSNATVDSKKLINRLRRAEGQLRGLERLIAEEADCQAILTQLSAARAALDQLGVAIISNRIKECLDGDNTSAEVDDLLKRYLKGVVK